MSSHNSIVSSIYTFMISILEALVKIAKNVIPFFQFENYYLIFVVCYLALLAILFTLKKCMAAS